MGRLSREEQREWDELNIPPSATIVIKKFEDNPKQLIPFHEFHHLIGYPINSAFRCGAIWLMKINDELHLKLTKKGKRVLELMEV